MAAVLAPASLFDSRSPPGPAGSDSEAEDLCEGTSTGASFRNLAGARPMTVASLLEHRVVFVPQEHTQPLDDIPYTPINLPSQVSRRPPERRPPARPPARRERHSD